MVCRDGIEQVVGVLRPADLITPALLGEPLDVEKTARPPLYVPESATIGHLLENFRSIQQRFALVIDQYGELQGVVTLTDVLTAIVGELPSTRLPREDVVVREDGSWLVKGDVSIEHLKSFLKIEDEFPGEQDNVYHTVGGFVMYMLGHIPTVAVRFEHASWRFEIVDMDGNRVDRVLVSRLSRHRRDCLRVRVRLRGKRKRAEETERKSGPTRGYRAAPIKEERRFRPVKIVTVTAFPAFPTVTVHSVVTTVTSSRSSRFFRRHDRHRLSDRHDRHGSSAVTSSRPFRRFPPSGVVRLPLPMQLLTLYRMYRRGAYDSKTNQGRSRGKARTAGAD